MKTFIIKLRMKLLDLDIGILAENICTLDFSGCYFGDEKDSPVACQVLCPFVFNNWISLDFVLMDLQLKLWGLVLIACIFRV